ncbi:TOPRIM nucleotidyl transferase/hydrolase domain-containing protein [Nitriliruptor alkaliphilus]|uniref:TOPRIM nucleotidyl transferase/hydrolase domain-containing protein n=1 Tax=Nitriliruptor alkaliphilus TaxID=427918 RepID=UPI000A9FC72B|nr:TOPRIM nucleotidyl transferase/hydrolase domain-containing protein [Nitriliruptor alkaliphilus]
MSTVVRAATADAVRRVAAAGGQLRCLLVVEGDSDRGALEALAARLGRDLGGEGVAILALGGASNLGHLLREVAGTGAPLRVVGLCDADQEGAFRRHLEAAGLAEDLDRAGMEQLGFFACHADLEDELIRALGIDAVMEVIAAQREHAAFETFRKQPAQRGRAVDAQLRRFIGTRSGRKLRYARAMVEALDPGCVPRPLAAVLACVP